LPGNACDNGGSARIRHFQNCRTFASVIFDRIMSYGEWMMMLKILKWLKNEKGATAIEYGLIAALVAIAAIFGMGRMGSKLNAVFLYEAQNM
jgi:pilus assembly protein Flp/PilA